MKTDVRGRIAVLSGVLASAAVLTTGCSSASNSGTDHSTAADTRPLPDPCQLLSLDQVTTTLGESADPGKPGDGTIPSCGWASTDLNSRSSVIVQLDKSNIAFDAARSAQAADLRTVPGLGQDAFFYLHAGQPAHLLEVKTARGLLTVTVVLNTHGDAAHAQAEQDEITLAKAALAKL